jgi:decaprenylphospho-beta-D-erythro-pentofuranosid-2-ulose 2-reductase
MKPARFPRVLILGATSAIAAEMARQLAAEGSQLYLLGGRSQQKLEALTGALGGSVVGAATADFDDTGANGGRVEAALAALGGVDLAVIAHGLLGNQLATEAAYDQALPVLTTNLLSVVSLLIPLGNHFEKARGGHIAVFSSVAADRGRPRNYTYAAAKGALNVYLQGLRSRLYPGGTGIHVLKVGPVHTPMTVDHQKNRLFAHPPEVARDILTAISRGRAVAYVPWYWRPIMAVVRGLPEPLFQRARALSGR